jgi:hypothetical protein
MLFFPGRFSFKQPEIDVYPTRKDLFQDTLLGKFFLLVFIICYHPDLFFMLAVSNFIITGKPDGLSINF